MCKYISLRPSSQWLTSPNAPQRLLRHRRPIHYIINFFISTAIAVPGVFDWKNFPGYVKISRGQNKEFIETRIKPLQNIYQISICLFMLLHLWYCKSEVKDVANIPRQGEQRKLFGKSTRMSAKTLSVAKNLWLIL